MRNPEIALEDRFEGVRKRAMTDIMEQSSYSENPGVVPGQASSLGVEERQSCYADTVVVAVVSEPGPDAVDRSEESDPLKALDGTGSDKFPKKWILS